MKLSRYFNNLRFPEPTIRRAVEVIEALPDKKKKGEYWLMSTERGSDHWIYNHVEEFFADYPEAESALLAYRAHLKGEYSYCELEYSLSVSASRVTVSAEQRSQIMSVMNVFESSRDAAIEICPEQVNSVAKSPRVPKIFIGHGRSKAWQELKNHLQDKHRYQVVAFETGARAGHNVRDILEDMLAESSLAFLVLTAEDETSDQLMRARQNVVHEVGLFQGGLGFPRAVMLVEDAVEEFSNVAGIQHIPFKAGHITGTFGDVLAVIRREFES